MHFEITASLSAIRKNLTKAQRNSSLFAEAPRVAGKTLRRGVTMKLEPEQFKTQEVMLKRLFDAGAIEIAQVDGERRRNFREEEENMGNVQAELKRAAESDAPPTPPKPSAPLPAVIALPPPPPEPVVEAPAAPATPMEEAGFVSPEKLVAAVDAENKQTEEQIEKAVASISPSEEVTPAVPTPAPSQPSQPAHSEKPSSKKGRR